MPFDDDCYHIDDDDGGTEGDGDVCDRCYCARTKHEDGIGACDCGRCRKFVNPEGS